ncbi:carbohydrate ABC transporter substrate-binding protein [Arsenicitalea aurantiaca]|uniref:Carbohydrate ABC transporter substrate-binding protein n=1 Tax=Arsenicitalea aurantiaca TaxID=1783274 RepID=A0A433XB22_9HYPH|nr:ABC transporter substrate-binding protein [Arsenicitalea aurantiaca]RUT31230.1 carbohydrate ABC transporter substrate-binding protein [Arsenicitalea aurantiaca]
MHKTMLAGVSAAALVLGMANAASAQTMADFEAMDLSGQTITVFGPWLTEDQEHFEAVIAPFEEATGADVQYAGSDSFEQQIVIDTQAGSPPNIAIFPQPGLAADLAARDLLVPLGDETREWVLENYAAGQSWVDLGTYANSAGEDDLYGFFYKVDVKSLVWYVPDNFADAGYEIPETLEDLLALSEQIVADGGTPWCIGLGSGAATGWPATDWVEDLMLRINTPEDYDAWVSNELPFNDPKVIEAIELFGTFARNEDWVDGGSAAVASTDFRDSPGGLFTVPPRCYMHHQASFIPSFFPEGTELGVDADFFYMPAFAERDLGQPVLGAGTLFAITQDSEGARAFIDYLKTVEANEIWMGRAGMLTPHTGVNPDAYASAAARGQGEILLNATTFRFDGSDLMPGAVGAGSFWTGMVDYVGGASAEDVANTIQQSWDAIK